MVLIVKLNSPDLIHVAFHMLEESVSFPGGDFTITHGIDLSTDPFAARFT